MLFEKCFVYGIYPADSGTYKGLKRYLIDDAWQALGQVKDGLHRVFSEQFCWSFCPLEMEANVLTGIIDGKASEVV